MKNARAASPAAEEEGGAPATGEPTGKKARRAASAGGAEGGEAPKAAAGGGEEAAAAASGVAGAEDAAAPAKAGEADVIEEGRIQFLYRFEQGGASWSKRALQHRKSTGHVCCCWGRGPPPIPPPSFAALRALTLAHAACLSLPRCAGCSARVHPAARRAAPWSAGPKSRSRRWAGWATCSDSSCCCAPRWVGLGEGGLGQAGLFGGENTGEL